MRVTEWVRLSGQKSKSLTGLESLIYSFKPVSMRSTECDRWYSNIFSAWAGSNSRRSYVNLKKCLNCTHWPELLQLNVAIIVCISVVFFKETISKTAIQMINANISMSSVIKCKVTVLNASSDNCFKVSIFNKLIWFLKWNIISVGIHIWTSIFRLYCVIFAGLSFFFIDNDQSVEVRILIFSTCTQLCLI